MISQLAKEQLHDCETLIGFAILCSRNKDNPVTYAQFSEAVNERMPEKSEAERTYLLDCASGFLLL